MKPENIKTSPNNEATSSKPRAKQLIEKYKEGKGIRRNFESYWQSLHDYFYVEAENINKAYLPGTEIDFSNLWDSTSLEAADVLASGFMNYLTPPTSKWFRLRTKDPARMESKAVARYLQDVEAEVYHMLNGSNFYNEILPGFKSSGVFGTSILLEEEDPKEDCRFFNAPIKQVVIVENAYGRVCEYYIEFEYTALQAITRFGIDNVSREIKENKDARGDKKYPFLLFIGERVYRDVTKEDALNMPIEAIWIDIAGQKTVLEGGYNEMPSMAHRFDKRSLIPWGFSAGMKALPMARMANAIAKTTLRTMMKHTDPPTAVPHNAFIMPFNNNPRAINYYKKGAINEKGIFTFGNQGDPNSGMMALEYYNQRVRSLMYNDVFLAFQQITKQMNNPEIAERINEKMTMLGPSVGRYMGEVLDPIIKRTIAIAYRRGKLPSPPDELIADPRYEIEYVSALAQAQKRTELSSLINALSVVGEMAQLMPDALDKINPDTTVDQVWGITGAPVSILRDDAEIQKIREARAEQQAQVNQLAMAQEGTKVAQNLSNAEKNMAAAGKAGI